MYGECEPGPRLVRSDLVVVRGVLSQVMRSCGGIGTGDLAQEWSQDRACPQAAGAKSTDGGQRPARQ